jgi:4-amino-4-deoxy-L-arabinose transferase-like glycosyltransferase
MSSGAQIETATEFSGLPRPSVVVLAAVAILILAPLVLVNSQALWLRWIAMAALAWGLPGALLVAHWRLPGQDLPTSAVLAMGLGLCWMILMVLIVHWLPGQVTLWMFIVALELGALALLVALYWRRPLALRPTSASTWIWILGIFLVAVLLRLPGLGYHELHGDEMTVLHFAKWAIWGADDIFARHAKGPGEIIVTMVFYRGLGTASEATARMPFALMGVGSVLATALLGRRMFTSGVGFWAGILLAANGFALGLSRIVQYQPAVLLLSVLAVLCAWEFARRGEARWLALVGVYSGFGIVMHYEFALVAPVLLVLFWLGCRRMGEVRRAAGATVAVGSVFAAIVAAGYLPTLLSPHFGKTERYMGSRLGGFGAFNLPIFAELGTFYNSIYFFVGLILLVVMGLVLGWRRARRRTLLLALWFLPFLVLHLFVMEFPGTHFYQFMPSWSLLAALPLAAVVESKSLRPVIRWGLLALAVLWLAVSAGYLYLAFFQQSPEYVFNYDRARVPFYWAPYGESPPKKPRYGFPVQAGWKALGTLSGWGCLEGSYTSNEGARSLRRWYLLPLERVESEEQEPDYVFVTSQVQTPYQPYQERWLDGYQRVGEVRTQDEPRIEIWARDPLPVPYVTYDAKDLQPFFNVLVPTLEGGPESPVQVRDVALGETLVLATAGAERTKLAPGETLHLQFAWQPQQALGQDYKLFVHIADAQGRPQAQWDGMPCLNLGRTSQWAVGETVEDHALVPIPDDMPPGEYAVLVGLYDGATGERLAGEAIQVTEIVVK